MEKKLKNTKQKFCVQNKERKGNWSMKIIKIIEQNS